MGFSVSGRQVTRFYRTKMLNIYSDKQDVTEDHDFFFFISFILLLIPLCLLLATIFLSFVGELNSFFLIHVKNLLQFSFQMLCLIMLVEMWYDKWQPSHVICQVTLEMNKLSNWIASLNKKKINAKLRAFVSY